MSSPKFYQIVASTLSHTAKSLPVDELLHINKDQFGDNPQYKDWIFQTLTQPISAKTFSKIVLNLMSLVQDASLKEMRDTGHKLSGPVKHKFVYDAVSDLLKYAPLYEDERKIILDSLETLISVLVAVKNGGLSPISTTIELGSCCCKLM